MRAIRRSVFASILAVLAVSAGQVLVAPAFAAGQAQVTVTMTDEKGEPAVGVPVNLLALDNEEKPLAVAPWTMKTNKKGIAFFPFLPYNEQGEGRYDVSITRDGYFIHEFRIESRQVPQGYGLGTLIHDDKGTISPGQQKLPPMMAKPQGVVKITLSIAPIGSAPAKAAPAAGSAPGQPANTAAAAPVPPAAPQDPLSNARTLMAQGKLADAEAVLKTLKETKPSIAVDFETARLYHLQEKSSEEKAMLRTILSQDPTYPGAQYELGRLAYEEGHTDQALAAFEAEYANHSDDPQIESALAALYTEVGRALDAIKVYETILAKTPANTDALVALDGLYTGQGEAAKSQEAYKKILALNPTGADEVYYKVGLNLVKRQDLSTSDRDRATAAFRKAVALNPKNAKAHRELGYALIGLGKLDEARPHFQTYLQLDPAAKDSAYIRQFLQGS